MMIIINIFIFLISFIFMELFSWMFHKYILHGLLWSIHKTHHQTKNKFFELNDLVSVLFAFISIILILTGAMEKDFKLWIGSGIAFYGIFYFILHDILIHKRFKFLKKNKNKYIKAISKAHQIHHKHLSKNPSESFGLLWVDKKYFREEE